MKSKCIVNSPYEIIDVIHNYKPYVIKIKCICCTENSFIKYEDPVITEHKLKIGMSSYPIKLIERVTIRYYNKEFDFKEEIQFKVSSKYFAALLNDDAKESLLEFINKE